MESKLRNAAQLIRSEGFAGGYSFIFLIRWAFLSDDKALLQQIETTLEELDSMPESASLAYAYAELFEATGASFCAPAAAFLLDRCPEDDCMLLSALAKCARVFRKDAYLDRALLCDAFEGTDAFSALGMLELYRATCHGEYLNRASDIAEGIRQNFRELFRPDEAYDGENPSFNSAVAVLYDELARITQEERWVKAREVQNHFLSLLADRYPTRVTFGLCALLSDAFEAKTVVCAVPEGMEPPELKALLSFYAPLTERIVVPSGGKEAKYFLMKKGKLEEIKGV